MTLSEIIQEAADRTKSLPNSELRNYLKSDLARCKALARVLEMDSPQIPPELQNTMLGGSNEATASNECVCPPGARDRSCSAH